MITIHIVEAMSLMLIDRQILTFCLLAAPAQDASQYV